MILHFMTSFIPLNHFLFGFQRIRKSILVTTGEMCPLWWCCCPLLQTTEILTPYHHHIKRSIETYHLHQLSQVRTFLIGHSHWSWADNLSLLHHHQFEWPVAIGILKFPLPFAIPFHIVSHLLISCKETTQQILCHTLAEY